MIDRLLELLAAVAAGGALVGVLGGGLVRRPQRGVLLLAALAPFNGLLVVVPHPGLVSGWKEGLVCAVVLATFVAPPESRAPARGRLPGWVPAAVGLVVLGVISAGFVSPTQGAVGLKIDFFYLLLPFALLRCPLDAKERDSLVSILMVTAVVTSAYGAAQQLIGAARLNSWGYEYNVTIRTAGSTLRSFSTFNQPFGFGLFEMMVLLVALPVALSELDRARNRWFLAATPLIAFGLLSSIVRAAIAGLVVGGCYLWVHRHRVLSHAVPPVLVAALLVPPSIFATVLSPTSLGERSAGWSETFGRVLGAPFGNGIGATGSAAEKAAQVAGRVGTTYQPDNYYFKTVFELGPLGLWLFALLLVSAGVLGHRVSRRLTADEPVSRADRRDAALASGFTASVLAAAAASTVATYFEIFPLDLYFWLLLGVL